MNSKENQRWCFGLLIGIMMAQAVAATAHAAEGVGISSTQDYVISRSTNHKIHVGTAL